MIVNPAGVYGPGPWAAAGLDGGIRDAIRGRLPAVPPGGMTLGYVDDVADGHIAAFDRGRPGERYILADGFATMREIVAVAVDEAGRGLVPPTMPDAARARASRAAARRSRSLIGRPPLLGRGQLHFLLWQARVDNSKAREELGIEFTPWREGDPRDRALDGAQLVEPMSAGRASPPAGDPTTTGQGRYVRGRSTPLPPSHRCRTRMRRPRRRPAGPVP